MSRVLRRRWPLVAVLLALLPLTSVPADSPAWCPPEAVEVDPYRLLRSLSLDLRGVVPSIEEYALVDEAGGVVPDALIDEWLAGDAFVERVVRRHGELFWPNVTNVRITPGRVGLSGSGGALWSPQAATMYRGDRVPCADEPAEFDANGLPIAYAWDDGTFREGWVEVAPYWDPENPRRVCAYEAQTTEFTSTGADCSLRGLRDVECGCGEALNRCRWGGTETPMRAAFGRDVELRVADVIARDASYLELFEGRTAYINGPLVHYWTHQSDYGGPMTVAPAPLPKHQLPDLHYLDADTWVEIPLSEEHAGVLTSPAFLLRFQTQRARANRVYNSLFCQPFQPPESGLPAETGEPPPLDLQVRDGCKYCHALLEPAAAYWGRWTPSGVAFLDPDAYPAERADCVECAANGGCSADCNRHYLVDALTPEQAPYLGKLLAYEFRRPEHEAHVELGPKALIAQGVADGRFTDCTVRTAARWLLGRDPTPDEEAWIDELERDFVAGDYRYSQLVRDIVTSPVYARVR